MGYHQSRPACALTTQPPQVTFERTFSVVLFHPNESLDGMTGSPALAVLKLGGAVIVLVTLPKIAGAELFNASLPPLEIEEAGSVLRSGVGYAVGSALLRLDEEKNNKFEVPMPLLGDDDCGVPVDSTASPARVELANGSNSYPNQGKNFLPIWFDVIPDCRFLLSRCHCKRWV